jgi:hypothetical protein
MGSAARGLGSRAWEGSSMLPCCPRAWLGPGVCQGRAGVGKRAKARRLL